MSLRSACSLGDLARVVRALDVRDPAQIELVAAMLGMPDGGAAAAVTERPSTVVSRPVGPSDAPAAPAPPRDATPAATRPEVSTLDIAATQATLEPLPAEPGRHRPPRTIPALESLLPAAPAPVSADAADASLFASRWQRAIASTLISTETPDGPIDLARLLDDLAHARAIETLPSASIYSTRKGLQLLIDIGDGMQPFAQDAATFERLVRVTAGRDGVEVLRFDRTPIGGVGRGTRRTWRPYRAPSPGTPILVVSDFGMAGRPLDEAAAHEEWRQVWAARTVTGCPLLALTPFPESRWPAWLSAIFAPLAWDRRTNAASTRRVAQRASRTRFNG